MMTDNMRKHLFILADLILQHRVGSIRVSKCYIALLVLITAIFIVASPFWVGVGILALAVPGIIALTADIRDDNAVVKQFMTSDASKLEALVTEHIAEFYELMSEDEDF